MRGPIDPLQPGGRRFRGAGEGWGGRDQAARKRRPPGALRIGVALGALLILGGDRLLALSSAEIAARARAIPGAGGDAAAEQRSVGQLPSTCSAMW